MVEERVAYCSRCGDGVVPWGQTVCSRCSRPVERLRGQLAERPLVSVGTSFILGAAVASLAWVLLGNPSPPHEAPPRHDDSTRQAREITASPTPARAREDRLDADVREAVEAFRKLEASTDVGTTRAQYAEKLAHAHGRFTKLLRQAHPPEANRPAIELLRVVDASFQYALDCWKTDLSYGYFHPSHVRRFLRDHIKPETLNEMVSSAEESVESSKRLRRVDMSGWGGEEAQRTWIQACWAVGSAKLDAVGAELGTRKR